MGARQSHFTEKHKILFNKAQDILMKKAGNTLCIINTPEHFAIKNLLEQSSFILTNGGAFTYVEADPVRLAEKFGPGIVLAQNELEHFPTQLMLHCSVSDGQVRDPGLDSYSRIYRAYISVKQEGKTIMSWSYHDYGKREQFLVQAKNFGVDVSQLSQGEMSYAITQIPTIVPRTYKYCSKLSCVCKEDNCGDDKEPKKLYVLQSPQCVRPNDDEDGYVSAFSDDEDGESHDHNVAKMCKFCHTTAKSGLICVEDSCKSFTCRTCLETGIVGDKGSNLNSNLQLDWFEHGFSCSQECHEKKPPIALEIQKKLEEERQQKAKEDERRRRYNIEKEWKQKIFDEHYAALKTHYKAHIESLNGQANNHGKGFPVLRCVNLDDLQCSFCRNRYQISSMKDFHECVICNKTMCTTCKRSGRPTIGSTYSNNWTYQWTFEYNKYGFACSKSCHEQKPQARLDSFDHILQQDAQKSADDSWKKHGDNIIAFYGVHFNRLSEPVKEQVAADDPDVLEKLDKCDLHLVADMLDKPNIHGVLSKKLTIGVIEWLLISKKNFKAVLSLIRAQNRLLDYVSPNEIQSLISKVPLMSPEDSNRSLLSEIQNRIVNRNHYNVDDDNP